MERKYLKPLRDCAEILRNTEGVNYIILCSDATDSESPTYQGGSGWNVDDEKDSPGFFTMVGGLVEHYLSEQGYSYIEKVRAIGEFNKQLLENVTTEGVQHEES